MISTLARRSIYLSFFFASSTLVRGYGNVTRRADAVGFQAADDIDVNLLYEFVKSGSTDVIGTYNTCNDCDASVETKIHSQADKMEGVLTFMSDMDIDCDGINWQCPGNPDGQSETTFGHADTYQMPWYVLPDEWYQSQGIVANNLGAVICDGKMFYAVFADSNGDSPQIIGETSLVLGNACFPDGGFSGAVGHQEADIAYIVFAGASPDGVGEETLEYGPLKELGDSKVRELLAAIGGGGQDPKPTQTSDEPEPTETSDEPEEPTETSDEPEEPTETSDEPEEPSETSDEPEEPTPTNDEPEEPTETGDEPEEPSETQTPEIPRPTACKRSNLTRRHKRRHIQ